MASGLKKVAGSKIYISDAAVTYKSVVESSDFSTTAWTEIKGWNSTGDLGAEQATLTQTLINQNITLYDKGVISFPIMTNVFVPMPTDPGQVAFIAAQAAKEPYAFKIEWDAEPAVDTGDTDLFYGFAMFGTKTGGDVSAGRLLNFPIQPIAKFISE